MIYFKYLAPDLNEHIILWTDARMFPSFRVKYVNLWSRQDNVQVLAVVFWVFKSFWVSVHVRRQNQTWLFWVQGGGSVAKFFKLLQLVRVCTELLPTALQVSWCVSLVRLQVSVVCLVQSHICWLLARDWTESLLSANSLNRLVNVLVPHAFKFVCLWQKVFCVFVGVAWSAVRDQALVAYRPGGWSYIDCFISFYRHRNGGMS